VITGPHRDSDGVASLVLHPTHDCDRTLRMQAMIRTRRHLLGMRAVIDIRR
jgi:hypothetical protein